MDLLKYPKVGDYCLVVKSVGPVDMRVGEVFRVHKIHAGSLALHILEDDQTRWTLTSYVILLPMDCPLIKVMYELS